MPKHADTPNHLHCSQCGGDLDPKEGQIFLKCPYCDSTVYMDRSGVVLHWYLADTMDEGMARSALARWMAGNQTRKDLDRDAIVAPAEFTYFPVWVIQAEVEGKEELFIEPASALSVTDIKNLRLPAGDMMAFEPERMREVIPPTIPFETVMSWHVQEDMKGLRVLEVSLVHLPLYSFQYTYQGKSYTAIVEGATGGVFANSYPKRLTQDYFLLTMAIGFVFSCIACQPFFCGAFIRSDSTRIILSIALALLSTPLLYIGAVRVALKK